MLRDRFLYLTVFVALAVVTLAYQFRYPFTLQVGGPIDRPLLSWIHDPQTDNGIAYRWTTGGSEMILPAWGAGNPVELQMSVTRWQPNDQIADLTLYVNGIAFADPPASGQGWQKYTLPITDSQFLASDDLRVKFETDTFIPKEEMSNSTDPRRLGIQLGLIRVLPLVNQNGQWRAINGLAFTPFKLPPALFTLYFLLCVLFTYLTLTHFKIPRVYAFGSIALAACALAVGLVVVRPYLTLFDDAFSAILLAGLALAFLARWVSAKFFVWGGLGADEREWNLLALMFAFAFVSKLAFLLYPQTISFDLWYHVHRLEDVLRGTLFWSIPSGVNEFGGQPVPYLPSYYLFLAPFAVLNPRDESFLRLVVQISAVILDSATIFFIYYWLKKYFDDGRAGLFAAWIYLVVPLAFIAISWGIYANIFGQFLTLLLVAALLELFDRLPDLRALVIITLLFALTMLAHTSVFASIVPMFAVWIALLFVLGNLWREKKSWTLIACILLAAVIAYGVYYSEFVGLVAHGTQQIAGSSTDASTRNATGAVLSLWDLLQPARTEFIAVPLYVYGLALAGFAWLIYLARRSRARGQFLLVTMLAAWFVAFALLIYVRAEFGFSSRYVNFVMPALAMCAGLACAWIYAFGAHALGERKISRLQVIGRLAAFGTMILLTAQGAYHWFVLVMFKYH